jgi:hypothetical protein
MKKIILIILLITIFSCEKTNPNQVAAVLGDSIEIQKHLKFLSTYVIKKPSEISDSLWFSDSLSAYKVSKMKQYEVSYLFAEKKSDTVYYVVKRLEWGRTFENYRLLGGAYVWGKTPLFLEEKFISIRYNQVDLDKVVPTIIKYLYTDNVLELVKETKDTLIQWPEKGVYYDKQTHKWELGKENDFYFLKQMKDSVKASQSEPANNSVKIQ